MRKRNSWKKVGPVILTAAMASSVIMPGAQGIKVQAAEPANTIAPENAEQIASSFMTAAINNDWKAAYHYFNEDFKKYVPEEFLPNVWAAKTGPFGKLGKQLSIKKENNSLHTHIVMTYEGEKGPAEVTLHLDKNGQIDDFFLPFYSAPPSQYKEPDYENKDQYSERQLTIGEGEFALPGTLTLPKGEGPFPAVVLVHGSGPNDQDESLNSTKAFRDIAVGLANEGIAVLRYEKLTREHHIKTMTNPKLSIKEETVDDALRAVQLLESVPEVSDQVFVLGHSQGGYALPRILEADKEKEIDGGIVVAGPSGKFQDLMLWQQQAAIDRAKKQGLTPEQLKPYEDNYAFWKQQMDIINNRDYSLDNLPKDFLAGYPYWWIELRDYLPRELAAKQTTPLFIMQGEKDLQVPASEIAGWKTALNERNNVTYKTYSNLTHLLVNYEGEPDLSEYAIPANVPQDFIQDIAKWVHDDKKTVSFTDVKEDFWAYKEIMFSAEKGYLNGYPAGTFEPNQSISRAQAAKILANALGFKAENVTDQTVFTDVPSDSEFLPYIRFLKQKGILSGYENGTFKPNETLTRAQMAKILSIAFELNGKPKQPFKDVKSEFWAADYIDALAANGITTGKTDGTFSPNQTVTRGQTAVFLYRTMQLGK
ncbi:dienelactone hydrolase [Bacillus ectoiniformans]|uniref:S-layer homology domain-containing protein n=1 Tax=Bacillus ectoiniformans TaxID=1494429 RepID=UPI00195DEF77|nr:S-layer homology domain-containing protein [Bacillus ectoiniformans]MBM7649056.1 dienelactone hydrolase [Bacillus ectoiniformans]